MNKKIIIGMIHLDYLPSQKEFKSFDELLKKAIKDLEALESGKVDAAIIENWKDETCSAFISREDEEVILRITKILKKKSRIPLGINVLPNDYRAALRIAEEGNLGFIQLDVFSDNVITDYSYSKANPFEIKVDFKDFENYKEKYGKNVKIMVSVHPKHYKMLDNQTLEQSIKKAEDNGADCIVITGILTGKSPDLKKLSKARNSTKLPIYIGSGLNKDNAKQLLEYAEGAIVGTAFKSDDFTEVIPKKVEELMKLIKN